MFKDKKLKEDTPVNKESTKEVEVIKEVKESEDDLLTQVLALASSKNKAVLTLLVLEIEKLKLKL